MKLPIRLFCSSFGSTKILQKTRYTM